jgi:site-specific recombinase XerD
MKFKQNLSIMFWLYRSKATSDGKAPLYARVTIEGKFKDISVGRKAPVDQWDEKMKEVTAGDAEARVTNSKIAELESDLTAHFKVLQSQHEVVMPEMLKRAYLGKPTIMAPKPEIMPATEPTLLEVFADFITKFEKRVEKEKASRETLKHWRTSKKKVTEFIKHHFGSDDLKFSALPDTFAEDYYDYITLEVPKPLAEITARKEVKWVKQIIEIGVKKKYISSNPINGFKCSGGDKEVLPLELYEVEAILKKSLTIDRLAQVRDAFVFQCFTGFAYQDIYNLTPENIVRVGRTGERWLIKDRGKTEVTEMVPILPLVANLIEKYKDDPYCKLHNRLLPINSNGRYNGYLKELADICGIKRPLNTHLARHTFADIMLNNGVPLEDVSKMLGHKSIRTTMRYCRVRKSRISENMAKLKGRLFTKSGKLRAVA